MYSIVAVEKISVLEHVLLQRIQDMYQTHRDVIGFDYIFYECWDIWGNVYENEYPNRIESLKKDLLKEDFDSIANSLVHDTPFIVDMLQTLESILFKYDFSVYVQEETKLYNKWVKEVW